MREPRVECPQCKKKMHPGYLLEHGDNNRLSATKWVEGAPEQSLWKGLKIKDRRVLPVVSFRCEACGYLESYARL